MRGWGGASGKGQGGEDLKTDVGPGGPLLQILKKGSPRTLAEI